MATGACDGLARLVTTAALARGAGPVRHGVQVAASPSYSSEALTFLHRSHRRHPLTPTPYVAALQVERAHGDVAAVEPNGFRRITDLPGW